jgi:hypothetical protein
MRRDEFVRVDLRIARSALLSLSSQAAHRQMLEFWVQCMCLLCMLGAVAVSSVPGSGDAACLVC